jgi:uncharacterized protein YoxC
MSASEIAAIIGSVVGTLLVIGFFIAFTGLLRTLRRLTTAIEELRGEVVPLAGQWRSTVDQVNSTVGQANAELARVDGLLTTAESVSQTVDSASRLAYLAMSNPIIKAMAFSAGTGATLRRLRRKA